MCGLVHLLAVGKLFMHGSVTAHSGQAVTPIAVQYECGTTMQSMHGDEHRWRRRVRIEHLLLRCQGAFCASSREGGLGGELIRADNQRPQRCPACCGGCAGCDPKKLTWCCMHVRLHARAIRSCPSWCWISSRHAGPVPILSTGVCVYDST